MNSTLRAMIHKIHNQTNTRLSSMKLSKQLLGSILFLSIVPMIIVSAFCYFISYNTILENTVTFTENTLNTATNEINNTILIIKTLNKNIQYESDLQTALRNDVFEDDYTTKMNTLELNSHLRMIQDYSSPKIFGVYLIANNKKQFKSNIHPLKSHYVENTSWYKATMTSKEEKWYAPHWDSYIVASPSQRLISYTAPFIDKLTGDCNGVLMVEIKAEDFDYTINNMENLKVSSYFILDEQNNIILPMYQYPNNRNRVSGFNKDNIKYEKKLVNGWRVVCMISKTAVVEEALERLTEFMLIIILITMFFSVFTSIIIANRISSPIKTLMYSMEKINSGNFNVQIKPNDTCYELKKLRQSFNTMAVMEAAHVSQIKEKQVKLRKAQFAALQAQINPHFLYNTLDTITWNIRMDEKEKAITAIMALTKFFRSSLSRGEDIITIKEELEQVSIYLEIQQLRYRDILTYKITSDEAFNNFATPKLILQPVVENALYHGLKNKEGKGLIEIEVSSLNKDILITVTDNGIGMPPEKIENINNYIKNKNNNIQPNNENGYGIINVNERINIYFGRKYGLTYMSEYGKFTKVQILLPKINKEQDLSKS